MILNAPLYLNNITVLLIIHHSDCSSLVCLSFVNNKLEVCLAQILVSQCALGGHHLTLKPSTAYNLCSLVQLKTTFFWIERNGRELWLALPIERALLIAFVTSLCLRPHKPAEDPLICYPINYSTGLHSERGRNVSPVRCRPYILPVCGEINCDNN